MAIRQNVASRPSEPLSVAAFEICQAKTRSKNTKRVFMGCLHVASGRREILRLRKIPVNRNLAARQSYQFNSGQMRADSGDFLRRRGRLQYFLEFFPRETPLHH
jgi:hypothetical protein